MKAPKTLHRRLLWPLVAAIMLAAGGAWLVGTLLFSQAMERRLSDQLEHAAAVLSEGTFPLTPGILERLAPLLRADIALIDANEEIGFATSESHVRFTALLADAGADLTMASRTAIPHVSANGVLAVGHELPPLRDPRFRRVALLADLSDIRRAARQSALWVGVAALIGAIALAWIAHRTALSITGPIHALAGMADAIARGDRQIRVPVRRDDEIGTLASSLNLMAARLDRFEQELVRTHRLAALGAMAARIAHEIRNPLTALKLNVQLLAETLPPDRRAVATELEDEMDRLELIVAGVLTGAQSAPVALHRQPVHVDTLVAETVRLFRPQLEHLGIRLELDLHGPSQALLIDPERMKQVLVNLLVNARDALPDGGRIRIRGDTVQSGSQLRLQIADDGPGLDDHASQEALAGGTSTKPQGLGLGLRLSRELIQAHGGTLRLARGDLGGLTAEIRLPCRGGN